VLLSLEAIHDMILHAGTKGLPTDVNSIRLGDIGGQGWRLHDDLQLPAAVLRRSALDNNRAWMRGFSDQLGVALCPHGKTICACIAVSACRA
jgi:D-serine dehydratase